MELNLDTRQEKLLQTSVFLARLIAAGIVFRAILIVQPGTAYFQRFLSSLTVDIISSAGLEAVAHGRFLDIEGVNYEITRDCLGWKSMAAFLGLIFASPRKASYRFILFGLTAITIGNLARLLTTIYLDIWGIVSFEIIHGLLWKWGLTALVLALWSAWYTDRF